MTKEPSNRLISEAPDDELPAEVRPSFSQRPTATRSPRQPNSRGPYPGRRQITAHIDQQLFRWLKSISATTERPMVAIMEDALRAYVTSFAAQKKFGET